MPEDIPSLPMMQRRTLLGYAIPAVNIPLFIYNIYQIAIHFQGGMTLGSQLFWEDMVVLILTAFLTYSIPQYFPVYNSKYSHTKEGLSIKRLLRKDVLIPYKSIDRADVFVKVDETIDEEAKKYAIDQADQLRKSGLKFRDFTNSDQIILNLLVEKNIYMLSPEKPKALLKELKRRNRKLNARIVELTRRGKRIQDLS
ncbi:hypothetical protein HN807_12350 [Candidatus Bathyarchaeota archaeon]|jgi:hypothetical protein|nr:hypothetical protein [Candidatus Bathyarchaeota archaeon]MBT4320447.1 hypothetical protein [Candidatus Bathyarchaeota archaeon]MBT4425245.1 hypothetical protein [Candidatus Bathyarchaeota archaeon]MBT5641530.1 hypothetical protein [Candidatus Bathyarchaeota archaeon]MBT6604897.1 hypothetical protein [Candidatus Bathyarchaeota archaeon]